MKPLHPDTVRRRLARNAEALAAATRAYERVKADLMKRCRHEWTFQPDPSGNNDSFYVCAACDRVVKRRP